MFQGYRSSISEMQLRLTQLLSGVQGWGTQCTSIQGRKYGPHLVVLGSYSIVVGTGANCSGLWILQSAGSSSSNSRFDGKEQFRLNHSSRDSRG